MRSIMWADLLWGKNAKLRYLMLAALLLMLGMLGSRELWTQEHRWADIINNMFFQHDFLHPVLNGKEYYDKPLLSYWLMAGFSAMMGKISLWSLRLPSALAGLLAVGAIYKIGSQLKDKRLGLLAGWLLLTSYYFIFWARTSNSDMLNLGGTLFAVAWYFDKKIHTSLLDYTVFFLILAFTALCKGLVGPVVVGLAILPDIFLEKSLKKHLHWRVLVAMIPAGLVYALPFWASTHFSEGITYQQNGLYEVYRENIMRYFQPFDHKGPIYTYFIFLPIYLFPWAFFFIPALFYLKSRWQDLSSHSKWTVWSTLLLFLFFTLSGSRRSYYVLPIVPFAILMTADWILSGAESLTKRNRLAGRVAIIFFVCFAVYFTLFQTWYYSKGGLATFNAKLTTAANQIKPDTHWNYVILDAESKIRFYLQLPPDVQNFSVKGERQLQSEADLLQMWPILKRKPVDTIILSRKLYVPYLQKILKNYVLVAAEPSYKDIFKKAERDLPVAFIPTKSN